MSALTEYNDIVVTSLVDLPDETKIEIVEDSKAPNTSDFIFRKEDHTLVNLLRMQLHRNEYVRFAGYRVPHPTQHDVVLKVRTAAVERPQDVSVAEEGSGATRPLRPVPTPIEALQQAVSESISVVDEFTELFRAQAIAKGMMPKPN